jgi:hypothetical protein
MSIGTMIGEFCQQKLARILSECVKCSSSDRSMLDWLTAERFIRGNPHLVEGVLKDFLARPEADGLSRNSLPPSSIDTSFEGLEQVHGYAVFERLFYPLSRDLKAQIRMPRYTDFRFG